MQFVSPKLSVHPSPDLRSHLSNKAAALHAAQKELQCAVLDALAAGVSIRETAALAQISTNTVQRWKNNPE